MTGFLLFKSASGTKLDCLRKHATFIFQNKELKVTIDTNLASMDFLDVTIYLCTGKYYPYRNRSNLPFYEKAISNQSTPISKQLSIWERHVSHLFINEDKLNKAHPSYKKAVKSCDGNKNLKFENIQTKSSRNRHKNLKF